MGMTVTSMDCNSCSHKAVCAFRKNREALEKELKEKTKQLEYSEFGAFSTCKYWTQIRKGELE